MKTIKTYMVAEGRQDSEGNTLPKRCVAGPYDNAQEAKKARDQLGKGFHVFECVEFVYGNKGAEK